jgi:hypothetical protein
MNNSSERPSLAEMNASLRETIAALTDCLRDLLNDPHDPIASTKAKLVLAKVNKLMRQLDDTR